jgi:hypothetical protein
MIKLPLINNFLLDNTDIARRSRVNSKDKTFD